MEKRTFSKDVQLQALFPFNKSNTENQNKNPIPRRDGVRANSAGEPDMVALSLRMALLPGRTALTGLKHPANEERTARREEKRVSQ